MAASTIKGITIEIGGDTTKLDKALSGVNKQSRDLQKELKEVEKGLKLDPKNTELLAQKQTLLKEAVAATSEKLDVLKSAEAQVQKQFENGEVSEEQYRALQREIIKTEADLLQISAKLLYESLISHTHHKLMEIRLLISYLPRLFQVLSEFDGAQTQYNVPNTLLYYVSV